MIDTQDIEDASNLDHMIGDQPQNGPQDDVETTDDAQ